MTKQNKWHVTGSNVHVKGTVGDSKDESRELLEKRMLFVTGMSRPWVFWIKRGFKIRRWFGGPDE